jgi:hypothetical protein
MAYMCCATREVTTPRQARARPSWKCRELFRCRRDPCDRTQVRGAIKGTRRRIVGIQDFFDAVANAEVGAVHVAGDDEDHRDRQVVVGHIRQPEGLGLRMEPTQEGQDRGPSALGSAEHMAAVSGFWA